MFNTDFKRKFKQAGLFGLIFLELAMPLYSFAQTNNQENNDEKLNEDKIVLNQILSNPLKKNTLESAMHYFYLLDNYCHSKEDSMQLDLHATNPTTFEDTLKIYFNYFHDNFAFPVDTIKSKPEITSKYGIRENPTKKQTGGPNKKFHYGWDLGSYYAPVYSISEGKVISTGQDKKSGKYLTIKYILEGIDKEIKISFAHLSKIYVYTGQKVKKGQKIAKSGNTGITTGAHLHFDIKNSVNEKKDYIDPRIIYQDYQYFK